MTVEAASPAKIDAVDATLAIVAVHARALSDIYPDATDFAAGYRKAMADMVAFAERGSRAKAA